MKSVTQLQDQLQELLRVTARQAGRESQFIQRERKLTGESFVTTLVWGWLAKPDATLEELSQTAALCGVEISAQGLAQRMTASAAACLRTVLEASLELVAQGAEGNMSFLQRFPGVYLLDSSVVSLPLQCLSLWPGCGNQNGDSAGLKLQTLWDYQGGSLHLSLHPARQHDAALPVPPIPAGAVRITDSAYFNVDHLQALAAAGGYYLTRVPSKVAVICGQKQRLSEFLQRHAQPDFDGWISLTHKALSCRLLAQRVPQSVVSQRQTRLRQQAKRKGQTVSQEALALAEWTIILTNLPLTQLSFEEAFVLLRLRWQIELLFKLFKQHAHLCHSRSHNPERILCEIYAKLLGLVIQHALWLTSCWDIPHRSLVKLAQTIRKFVFLLLDALWRDTTRFLSLLTLLQRVLHSGCRLNKRKTHPSHFQRLLSVS